MTDREAAVERAHSYVVRDTIPVGSVVALTRAHVEYDSYGVPIDYPAGIYGHLLSYTNAGFRGIEARIGITTDKGERAITVSAGAICLLQ